MSNELIFLKYAEEDRKRDLKKEFLKDIGQVAGGTALGAALGYGTGLYARKYHGDFIDKIDPNTRMKYLGPTATGLGGLIALTKILRDRSELRKKQKQEQTKEAFFKSKERKNLEQEMRDQGMSEEEIGKAFGSTLSNATRVGMGTFGGAFLGDTIGDLATAAFGYGKNTKTRKAAKDIGAGAGMMSGLHKAKQGRMARGKKALLDHMQSKYENANK